jgi:hypothetical protein
MADGDTALDGLEVLCVDLLETGYLFGPFAVRRVPDSSPGDVLRLPFVLDEHQTPGTMTLTSLGFDENGKPKATAVHAVNISPLPEP